VSRNIGFELHWRAEEDEWEAEIRLE